MGTPNGLRMSQLRGALMPCRIGLFCRSDNACTEYRVRILLWLCLDTTAISDARKESDGRNMR